jgi:DNA (cytosine-5)-methyltransferase 1
MNGMRMCDMFCGLGGVSLAFRQAGFCPVFACEIDPAAAALYEANHCLTPTGDIAAINPADVPEHEVLAASPPCTPHSRAGLKGGHGDERSHVLVHLLRILAARRPPAVLIENAADMANYGGGRGLKLVRECLRGLGYKVSWRVLRASDFGAAQHRARAFVVGSRTRRFDFDALKTRPPGKIADILDTSINDGWLDSAVYALLDHPRVHRSGRVFAGFVRGPQRTPGGDPTLAWTHDASRQIYSAEGLGPTLTTQNNTRFRVLVGGRVRRITIQECKKYMGYPDDYAVGGSWAQARMGNSVYAPLVRELARQVAVQLLGVRAAAVA